MVKTHLGMKKNKVNLVLIYIDIHLNNLTRVSLSTPLKRQNNILH